MFLEIKNIKDKCISDDTNDKVSRFSCLYGNCVADNCDQSVNFYFLFADLFILVFSKLKTFVSFAELMEHFKDSYILIDTWR